MMLLSKIVAYFDVTVSISCQLSNSPFSHTSCTMWSERQYSGEVHILNGINNIELFISDIQRAVELLEHLQRSGELASPKLAALQKVLQSDFCTAVREVYEHVYETVDISGSPEIRANATAKATVAAFAASEGHAHPRVVELPKTEEGNYVN